MPDQTMSIGHQNIRSLANRPHYLQLKIELSNLQYDVYGVSKTWLHSKIDSKNVSIDGYQIYRRDRVSKVGGGVAAYVSKKYKVKVIKELCQPVGGIEQLWLQIKQTGKMKIMIGVVYVPPQIARTKNCTESIYPMISTSLAMSKSVCMMGDFNINFKDNATQITSMQNQFNLKQVIESATHFGQKEPSILDHIYVTKDEKVITTSSLPGISDHYATTVSLDIKSDKQEPPTISYRSMRYFSNEKYIQDLIDESWHNIFEHDSPHQKAKLFEHYMISAMDKNCPVVQRKLKSRHTKLFNSDIREAKRQKFSWLQQYNANGHFIAKIMYKHYQKKERALLRKA